MSETSNVICPDCGFENPGTPRFCARCGKYLRSGENTQSQSPTDAASGTWRLSSSPPATPDGQPAYRVLRWDQPAGQETERARSDPAQDGEVLHPFRPDEWFGPDRKETARADIPPPPAYPAYPALPQNSPTGTAGPTPAEIRKLRTSYTPYTPDTERKLQSTPAVRTWLLPVIIVAALLLLGLGGAVGYLMTTTRSAIAQCQLPSSPTQEDQLKYTICLSNQEEIQAWKTLDTSGLAGTRTGAALQEEIAQVQQLQRNNMYAVPMNTRLDFKSFRISGNTATVQTVEEWSVTVYDRSSRQAVGGRRTQTLNEVYHLIQSGGKWLIQSVDFLDSPGGQGA